MKPTTPGRAAYYAELRALNERARALCAKLDAMPGAERYIESFNQLRHERRDPPTSRKTA